MSASTHSEILTKDMLQEHFAAMGLAPGAVVVAHASLSAFGHIAGGATTVIDALRSTIGDGGTLVVPTFTPQISDPCPHIPAADADSAAEAARGRVPLFTDATPTPMGAVPNALLAQPGRLRGRHPQASVAALGPRAQEITDRQPYSHALGADSPFARMYRLKAHILLLGVGHNRNSFLHYAETLTPHPRAKTRRFPALLDGERAWVETPDAGDDNGRFFPSVGAEADTAGLITHRTIGAAKCQLMHSRPFTDFAVDRLTELLAADAYSGTPGR
ncbi:aminoglycoside N(3)-acetyltransferase [Streptomyces sp. NPDC048436]|uniref:aminoglycoside N(3)-acetyltransferase n=1 Tax=Streptomyces sp. NPDC048436 TaxID=3365550 RepID=UPI0037101BC3